MKIKTTINDGTVIISPEGRIDTNNAPEFGEEIENVISNATELIFDLDKLEYISSAGLRVLLRAQKNLHHRYYIKF